LQLLGVTAKRASFQLVRAFDFHIGHHYGPHFLMNIDPPLACKTYCFSWAGAESVPQVTLTKVAGYRHPHRGKRQGPFIRSTHTLRIRHVYRLDCSIDVSISPFPAFSYCLTLSDFHEISRAAGPS
jgi:hypothetical protein